MGRTTATLVAAALVGVLVPGIALLSVWRAPSGRTMMLGPPPEATSSRPAAVATAPGIPPATTITTTATTTRARVEPTTTTTTIAAATSLTVAAAPQTLAEPIVTYPADVDLLNPERVAIPLRVVIPTLDVDGPVLPAGVDQMQELDVPPDAGTLVWYLHGPTPGATGSAVIAGHLNWRGVEGVFANLAAVPVGEIVTVLYDDGSQRDFAVRAVELVPKPAVAVNGVFARRGERLLRLVTCGGEFDDATNHYRSNVIVTAAPL